MTEKERLQLRLQPETREKIQRWQSAAGCRSMNEFVEKAVNFYADYLASDDSGVLLSPAIQSAIDGQLQEFKEQVKSLLFKQAVELDMGISRGPSPSAVPSTAGGAEASPREPPRPELASGSLPCRPAQRSCCKSGRSALIPSGSSATRFCRSSPCRRIWPTTG